MDKRNQSVANYLMDHPEAGTQIDPYAKSQRNRRVLAIGLAVVVVGTLIFGSLALMLGVGILSAVAWKLDVHPWLHGYERRRTPPSDHD
jgi:hypothetical protein